MPRISSRIISSPANDSLTIEMHIKISIPAKLRKAKDASLKEKVEKNAQVVGAQVAEAFKAEVLEVISN